MTFGVNPGVSQGARGRASKLDLYIAWDAKSDLVDAWRSWEFGFYNYPPRYQRES